jgi:hypothetical protein
MKGIQPTVKNTPNLMPGIEASRNKWFKKSQHHIDEHACMQEPNERVSGLAPLTKMAATNHAAPSYPCGRILRNESEWDKKQASHLSFSWRY